MSLYALQVTSTDITQLQQGILFTTTNCGRCEQSSLGDQRAGRYADGELLRQSVARHRAKYIAGSDGRDRADGRASPDGCDADQPCDEPGHYSDICKFCFGESIGCGSGCW